MKYITVVGNVVTGSCGVVVSDLTGGTSLVTSSANGMCVITAVMGSSVVGATVVGGFVGTAYVIAMDWIFVQNVA